MHKGEKYLKNKVYAVSGAVFLLGFLETLYIYVLSTYFGEIVGAENVSYFYMAAYAAMLLSLLFLQPLIRYAGKARAAYFLFCVSIALLAFLAALPPSFGMLFVLVLFLTATSLIWVVLDVLLEGFSNDERSGRIRGLYLTVMNLGILIAPLLSSRILIESGYSGIFLIALIGFSFLFLYMLLVFRHDNEAPQEHIRLGSALRTVLRHRALFDSYLIATALNFFYAMMIIYTPLYLLERGFGWDAIGLIFTFMLLPFIFIQYPLGLFADRKYGEKELLILSFLITVAATLALGYFSEAGFAALVAMLVFTRVGVAGIEVLNESYFFKHISGRDVHIVAFFRTARPLANIVGGGLAGITLAFFPLESIFFLTAVLLAAVLARVFFLKDTKPQPEG